MLRLSLAALAVAAGLSGVSHAQSCESDPEFAAHRTANGSIRAQYNAVSRGEWPEAIHFGNEIANSGQQKMHRAAALNNLCYAYAATARFDEAVEACTSSLELRENNWRALNNRGAAHWLAGDRAAAAADFAAAQAEAPREDEVEANAALIACAS